MGLDELANQDRKVQKAERETTEELSPNTEEPMLTDYGQFVALMDCSTGMFRELTMDMTEKQMERTKKAIGDQLGDMRVLDSNNDERLKNLSAKYQIVQARIEAEQLEE